MLTICLIALIFATSVIMYLVIDRDRAQRANTIAFLRDRASAAERVSVHVPAARNMIGDN